MREITPYLYATEKDSIGFFKKQRTNAFYLKRENGDNYVVYNSAHLEFDEYFLKEQGGVARQYLSHYLEANETCGWMQNTFENVLYCHDEDELCVNQYCMVNGTFRVPVKVGQDFEIIPMSGNTSGSTCFYWLAPDGNRVMFIGDTLIPDDRGEWMIHLKDQTTENEKNVLDKLIALYDYEVDLIVPQSSEGEVEWLYNKRTEWHDLLNRAIVRLRTKLLHITKKI